jgi:hypothetical protein
MKMMSGITRQRSSKILKLQACKITYEFKHGEMEMDANWTGLRMLTGKKLKSEITELWFRNHTTGYFLTLSFNRRFLFEHGIGVLDEYFKRILQGAHGRRWQERIRRVQNFEVYGFCEYHRTNVHFHLGVWGEKDELAYLKSHGAEEWFELQPQGDFLAETINSVTASADYSHKDIRDRDSQASLYVYLFPDKRHMDEAKNRQQPNINKNRAQIRRNRLDKCRKLRGKVGLTKKKRGMMARLVNDNDKKP